jgi:hypothetical protein
MKLITTFSCYHNNHRFWFSSLLLLLITFLPTSILHCKGQSTGNKMGHTAVRNEAENDSLTLIQLFNLAYQYSYLEGDSRKADSISDVAIEIARGTYRPQIILMAYILYLESNNVGLNYDKALNYGLEALNLCENMNNAQMAWRCNKNLSLVYQAEYKYKEALEHAYRALSISETLENDIMKAESYLQIGSCLEGNNQHIEAFRNYLNAKKLAEKTNNQVLLINSYSQLSSFFKNNKMYDKASFYKLREVDLLKNHDPVDSLALNWAMYDLQVIMVNSDNQFSQKVLTDILNYAFRHKVQRLKNFEISLYRTYLIKTDQIGLLDNFYNIQFPEEMDRLKKEDPALQLKLKAYFFEEKEQLDSAYLYFNKAEELIQNNPNIIYQSNFYIRFGQYLARHRHDNEAIIKFEKAYELAKDASYFDYMLTSSSNLESLHAELENYQLAYNYSVLNRILNDSIHKLSKKEQMIVLEIGHEADLQEMAVKLEEEKTIRRHNIQYTAIIITIIIVFIILIMLGSFQVPKWAIHSLGFFSFIFLFEFIIMVADHKIIELTHGEPWKILGIKILLIAFLLPFHHWIESKVVEYLTTHKLINLSNFSFQNLKKRVTELGDKKQVNDSETT